jgi:DSF synthase
MDMQLPHAIAKLSLTPSERRRHPRIDLLCSEQLSASYATGQHAVWLRMHPAPRPSFNRDLLRDLATYCQLLEQSGGEMERDAVRAPIDYVVLASAVRGVFNFGGDLALFMQLIESRDRRALLEYGTACIDVLHRNYRGHGIRATTISLVQGQCLGGGFEAALSSDVIIAERSARFGFPEILFNLFPGMGAYSFLQRRVGREATEQMLSSGEIFTADDMLRRGIVDAVCEDGEGESAVQRWIDNTRRTRNGLVGIARARRRVCGIDYEELEDVVRIWVDTAMDLSSRDLKLMQRLVTRQDGVARTDGLH